MTNFELENENAGEWEETEFFTYKHNVATYLVVDWNTQEAEVEKLDVSTHRGFVVWDSASVFELEPDVDFSEFKNFYDKAIKPTLALMSNEIERQWVDKVNVLDIEYNAEAEANRKITAWYEAVFNMLVAAPKHNLLYAWTFNDVEDYYEEEGGLITFLENNGLDFRHVKLSNEICEGVAGHLARDNVKLIMPFEVFVAGLKKYQASYQ